MTLIIRVFVILILSSCSNLNDIKGNSTDVELLEKTIEFNQVNSDDVVVKARQFIKGLNIGEVKFEVIYSSDSTEIINEIQRIFTEFGLPYSSYKLNMIDDLESKKILISAKYYIVKNNNCGCIGLLQGKNYEFGCAVEKNRITSLVNPM